MERTNKPSIAWIDAAKGICIIMVVFFHVVLTSYHHLYLPGISINSFPEIRLHETFIKAVAPLRIPLFFMISGFLASRAALISSWSEVTRKRIYLFVYLYILWSILQWFAATILHGLSNAVPGHSSSAIYARNYSEYIFLLIQGSTDVWYLYALPVYFIGCKVLVSRPWAALLLFLGAHTYGRIFIESWPAISIFANGVYFCLGCFWGKQIIHILENPGRKRWGAMFVVLVACVIARLFFKDWQAIPTSIVAIALVVISLKYIQTRLSLKLLCQIGQRTLPIYVIHRILIELPDIYLKRFVSPDIFAASPIIVHAWLVLYPTMMSALIIGISLAIWKATNRGVGKFLYALPHRHDSVRASHRIVN